jgi:hypothetical protein
MINFKEKSQVFIMGVMVGLIIAGGFFILKLDDYFTELNFYKNVAKTFYLHSKNTESIVKSENTEQVEKIKSDKITTKKRSASNADSIHSKNRAANFVLNADTLNSHLAKDSASFVNNASEDIVVRKDELLSNKTMEVINLNPVVSLTNYADSLLQKVSGIRDDRNSSKQFFNIELWQSPLNYRGYKMSKYKIVLYGIASVDAIKVYKIDDGIYLKNASSVYKLEQSSDFKPYQSISDASIINKLK